MDEQKKLKIKLSCGNVNIKIVVENQGLNLIEKGKGYNIY